MHSFPGAPGCIDLKREFKEFKIAKKPKRISDGKITNNIISMYNLGFKKIFHVVIKMISRSSNKTKKVKPIKQ